MKTLAASTLVLSLGLVACGNLNPSAMAQAAGAATLKQVQEGKGLTAEGLAKAAAEGAGVPTDAEGLAKAAGLPTVPTVPGVNGGGGAKSAMALLSGSKQNNALGDATNAIATANSLATMVSAQRAPSNAGAKAPPTNGPAGFAAVQPAASAPTTPAPVMAPAPAPAPDDMAGANFRIAKLNVDDVRLSAVACRLAPGSDVGGLFGPAVIGAGFRERQARIDACSRKVTETRVTWVAADSKTTKVRATGDDPKINACVERALKGSVAMVDGACAATLTLGKSR